MRTACPSLSVRARAARLLPLLMLAALGCTAARAEEPPAAASGKAAIEARYQQERAACEDGKSNEDRATCLREAAAARAAALQGELEKSGEDYRRNELARCDAVPAGEREVCRRRVLDGAVQGSVGGGGIIREYREIILPSARPDAPPAPPAPSAPSAPSAPAPTAR